MGWGVGVVGWVVGWLVLEYEVDGRWVLDVCWCLWLMYVLYFVCGGVQMWCGVKMVGGCVGVCVCGVTCSCGLVVVGGLRWLLVWLELRCVNCSGLLGVHAIGGQWCWGGGHAGW